MERRRLVVECNRELAAELVISEHTVARHLQHILPTLGDASENTHFDVNAEQAFADRPLGMQESAAVRA